MSEAYDLIVIGAGPGGYKAAARASQLGMRVACVEKAYLGGTCLNVGCIPSKALLESSEMYHQAHDGMQVHGVVVGSVELDLPAMMERKDKIVGTMVKGIGGLFKGHKVDHVVGAATISGAGTVDVSGEQQQTLRGERILIATGSAPIELPALPFDGEHLISSTEALCLETVPERLIVIGAGAIGLEMGSVWNRLGTEVLVVEFMDHILPGMDREVTGQLQRLLQRQGIKFELGASAQTANVVGGKVELTIAVGDDPAGTRVETCDRVLVAVGRRPYLDGLLGNDLQLETDPRGHLVVDGAYQTSVPGIYAIGDAIPGPMLAHKAEEEGVAAVERMAGKAGQVNYDAIPAVVYVHPELAAVGVTEEQAVEQEREFVVGKHQFRANARAHSMNAIDGLVKVISDAHTDRLLGMHILGPQASHLIAEGAVALEFAASTEDVARSVHAHPSLSEVVKEAAWSTLE